MARLFDDANTEYFVLGSAILTAAPMTVSVHFNTDQAAQQQVLFALGQTSTVNNTFWLQIASGNALEWIARSTSNGTATSSINVSLNTWHHALARETSATSRSIRLDGGNEGTNGTDISPSAPVETLIGLRRSAVPANPFSGKMGDVALWNVSLTDDEGQSLYRGVSPNRVRRSALVGWWPLLARNGDAIDYSGQGNDLTDTNTVGVATDGPPTQPPFGVQRREIIVVPTAAPAAVYSGRGVGRGLVRGVYR